MAATLPEPGIIRGRFIRLEPLTRELLPELHAAIGHPEVFAGGYGGGPAAFPPTLAEFDTFARGYYNWVAGNVYAVRLPSGQLVGTSTLTDFDVYNETAHIGWTAYSPSVWGSAVNPEAKLLLLDLAFDSGFGRVKIQADAVNARSRAAITKLGATFEGITRRDRLRPDGTWRDTAVFSILADEWPAVREGLLARLAAFD